MAYQNRYGKVKYPEIVSYQKFLRVKMSSVGDNSFTEKEIQVPADISEGKIFAIHSIEFEQPALAASGDRFALQVSLKEEGAEVGFDDRDLLYKFAEKLSAAATDNQQQTRVANFYPPLVCSKDKLFIGVTQKTGAARDVYIRIGFSLRWMNAQAINSLALDQLQ